MPRDSSAALGMTAEPYKHLVVLSLLACMLSACATTPRADEVVPFPGVAGTEHAEVAELRDQLLALSPLIRRDEAERLSSAAHEASRQLASDYRLIGPPLFHNFLVNAGVRARGLCHQWTRDLGDRLARLQLRTLVLHWGAARAGTLREHNCIVVTARGQPFAEGVVLDGWRHSGQLFSIRVAADRYPWKEDRSELFAGPTKKRTTHVSRRGP